MRTPLKLSFILAISTLVSACGGDGSKKSPTPIDPPANTAPVIESFTTSTDVVTTGTSVRFDWNITDTSGDSVSCTFDPLGNGEVINISDCLSTQSTTYTYVDQGAFSPTLTATDKKNASSTTVTHKYVSGNPGIVLRRPLANEVINQTFTVNAQVGSTYEISSVTAQIGGKSIPLIYDLSQLCGRFSCPGFAGKFDMTGFAEGEYTLEIIAQAYPDKQSRYLERIKYDARPTLTVSSPAEDTESTSVAAPLIPIAASCSDTGVQGCTMRVFVSDGDNKTLASGNSSTSINQTIDLSAYAGRQVELIFSASDSSNQLTQIRRKVYVEVSPYLTQVAAVNGVILDAKDNRLLYKTLGAQSEGLYIFDRAQNITTQASLPADSKIAAAYLSNFGAVFIAYNGEDSSTQQVYDWNGSDLYPLAQPVQANSLKVSGEHAIWSEGFTLVHRNLATLSNSILTTSGGNWQNSVTSGGVAAWWSTDNQIYINNGTTTQVTNDTLLNYYVTTDGTNIVYTKSSCCTTPASHAITLFNGSNEITLREAKSVTPTLGSDYQVRDGWVSYTDISSQNNSQVWTYSPLGQKVQRTFFATSSRIDTLGDDGQLMLFLNSKRYLSTETGALTEINSSLGVSYYINGKWYLTLGGLFFSVNTP